MNFPKIFELPYITDNRGSLTFFQNPTQLPFVMKTSYLLYNMPLNNSLEYNELSIDQQIFIIALSGSLDVTVQNKTNNLQFLLNRSNVGLFIPDNWKFKFDILKSNCIVLLVSNLDMCESDFQNC